MVIKPNGSTSSSACNGRAFCTMAAKSLGDTHAPMDALSNLFATLPPSVLLRSQSSRCRPKQSRRFESPQNARGSLLPTPDFLMHCLVTRLYKQYCMKIINDGYCCSGEQLSGPQKSIARKSYQVLCTIESLVCSRVSAKAHNPSTVVVQS